MLPVDSGGEMYGNEYAHDGKMRRQCVHKLLRPTLSDKYFHDVETNSNATNRHPCLHSTRSKLNVMFLSHAHRYHGYIGAVQFLVSSWMLAMIIGHSCRWRLRALEQG
jgi:hypothetical protein